MRLSGEPASVIEDASPATTAITTTTSAIPPPVIKVDTRRTSRLRKLYFSGIAIFLFRTPLSDHPQRFHDVHFRGRPRRNPCAEQSNHRRRNQRLEQHRRGHPHRQHPQLGSRE